MPDLSTMSNFQVMTYLNNLATIHEASDHAGIIMVHEGICQAEDCGWMVDAQLRLRARLARNTACIIDARQ